MATDPASGNWHLDKRVPVALILSLAIYFFGGAWWVSKISSRVDYIELQVSQGVNLPVEIGAMKEQLRGIERSILRVETVLDNKISFEEGKIQ
jgi:hypothetical protein